MAYSSIISRQDLPSILLSIRSTLISSLLATSVELTVTHVFYYGYTFIYYCYAVNATLLLPVT